VDLVIPFDEVEPTGAIAHIRPDVLVKGAEYEKSKEELPGANHAASIRYVPMLNINNKRKTNTTAKAAFIAERVKGASSGEVAKTQTKGDKDSRGETSKRSRPISKSSVRTRKKK
jgi:hypothetical protein